MEGNNKTPPKWVKPEQVMRMFRQKKKALQKRLTNDKPNVIPVKNTVEKPPVSRNPFKRFESETQTSKRPRLEDKEDIDQNEGPIASLLNNFSVFSQYHTNEQNISFVNKINCLINVSAKSQIDEDVRYLDIPIDWTLRSKVRILSEKPFPWNEQLKTCEEASSITGFVRCLDADAEKKRVNLDSGSHAKFHQCCMVWQHPCYPWLKLFPRTNLKKDSTDDDFPNLTCVRNVLHKAWIDSFRCLLQLLKAKQCPYFYVISNTFVCLFRASGIGGLPEINAQLTPTTVTFRKLLTTEGIDFTMPLKQNNNGSDSLNSDPGYYSLECDVEADELLEDDDVDKWLLDIGMGKEQVKKLTSSQLSEKQKLESKIDETPSSLIFTEGVEAYALFNYLINDQKSTIAGRGSLASVPPTLVSPVAFSGSTLQYSEMKRCVINVGDKQYHSVEIKGPILPHAVHNLCDLLKKTNLDKFTMTFGNVDCTTAFTKATDTHYTKIMEAAPDNIQLTTFGEVNLSDCGLNPADLTRFCAPGVKQFNSVKFSDSHFSLY